MSEGKRSCSYRSSARLIKQANVDLAGAPARASIIFCPAMRTSDRLWTSLSSHRDGRTAGFGTDRAAATGRPPTDGGRRPGHSDVTATVGRRSDFFPDSGDWWRRLRSMEIVSDAHGSRPRLRAELRSSSSRATKSRRDHHGPAGRGK